jgi:hypothetical protein
MRRIIRLTFVLLIGLIALPLALLPSSWLPASWQRFVLAKGTFDGTPVQIAIPSGLRCPAPAEFQITMERSVCHVSLHTPKGNQQLFLMERGDCSFDPRSWDGYLVLDPKGAKGTYRVFVGSKWQPFAPLWRFIFFTFSVAMLVGASIAAVLRKPLVSISLVRRLGRKRLLFLIVAVALSDFCYSPVHEFGHYAMGVLLGGKVDHVAWTVLSGDTPHVSFRSLPPEAQPWMSAAGTLFPLLVGAVLVSVWLIVAARISWYASAALLVFGAGMLFSSSNAIPQVMEFEKLPYEHMGVLAWHLGLRGWSMALFVLSPLALTAVMYGLIGYRLHSIMRRSGPSGDNSSVVP